MSCYTQTSTNGFCADAIPNCPVNTEPWTTTTCVVCCHPMVGKPIASKIGNVCNMSCYSNSTRIFKQRYSSNTGTFRCASCNATHTFEEKWEKMYVTMNAYYCSYACSWAPVIALAPPRPKAVAGSISDSAFAVLTPVVKHTHIINPRVITLALPHIVPTWSFFSQVPVAQSFASPSLVAQSSVAPSPVAPSPVAPSHTPNGFNWRTILFIMLVVICAIIYHQMTAPGTEIAVRK